MNQTKKRLSIIELAISITDIETIKLQMTQLDPLRINDRIDEILSHLEKEDYAHAQNLISIYTEEVHDTVTQRVHEVDEILEEETKEEESKSLIDTYDFLSESSEKVEDTKVDYAEKFEKTKTLTNDYSTLLDINSDEVFVENIKLNISENTGKSMIKEKIDFNLDAIPKDNFFNKNIVLPEIDLTTQTTVEKASNSIEEKITTEEVSEKSPIVEPQESIIQNTKTTVVQEEIFYPAMGNIYSIFQDIKIKYPSVNNKDDYSDTLEIWLEQIEQEGYTEAEVEEIITHIEKLSQDNKAEAAQFLQVTSGTQSKYAKFILARALYRGILLKRNLDESFKIMNYLAFDEKYPEALCDLAQFYENGIAIEKNKLQAEMLYKEAMDLGIKRAKNHYERIQKESQGFFSFFKS